MSNVTTKQVRGKLNSTQKVAGGDEFIWKNSNDPKLPGEGVVNGLRIVASNLMPANLTKGTASGICSSLICGNWADLLVGQWGAGIDIMLDAYTHSSTGAVRIIAMTDVDFAVRHAESFVKVKDILTT